MAVEYLDGDYISDTHWLSIREALKGNAILSGMAVTPNATQPPLEVDIAAGVYYANKTRAVYAGGSEVLDAAHATYDRWDIITGDSTGTLTYTAGTAAAIPHPPDLPANETLITAILVPATVTSITAAMIHNMFFISELLEHASRHENGGDDEISVLGLSGLLGDAQTPLTHDHTKHTNRTRYVGRGVGQFQGAGAATPPVLTENTLGGSIQQYYRMPTGVDGDWLYTTIPVPQGFTNTTACRMNIIGCQEDAGTGNILINVEVLRILKAGGTVPAVSAAFSPNAEAVPNNVGETMIWNNSASVSLSEGDKLIVKVRREGTDLSDTFGGDWGFQGLRFDYESDE